MASRNIVYIREFDKFDDNGDIIGRNTGCENLIKSPFRKYCSKECSKQFEKWYYHNFYWDRVRSDIFKRDNYTCQICRKKYPYTYRRKFARSRGLECDHIIPKSLYKKLGYQFDSLENQVICLYVFSSCIYITAKIFFCYLFIGTLYKEFANYHDYAEIR